MKGGFKMTFANFIKENKEEIDQCIRSVCSTCTSLNNKDREDWICNDEGLYQWARNSGVKI